MEPGAKEQKDRDDVKSVFAQLESAAEQMVHDDGAAKPESKDVQSKTETTYSTRGRPQEESLEAAGDLLSIAKELGVTDAPATRVRESFLSDSLTEKEIRTRTRVLPNLDGMNSLRKGEIKSDLAIARGDKPLAKKRKGRESDDTPDDATMDTADEDPSVYRTVEIGNLTLGMPSNSFVPPAANPVVGKRPSPRQVDSIVAYNPPRPPESIGAKKEHRLRNWERRPDAIENDLLKYRKTVQMISDELRNTEIELETVTAVDNILRRHFISHIHNLSQEISSIQDEMARIQQECLDLSGATGGRTRTRGSAKAGSIMRDILQTLKSKGQGMMECEATQGSDLVPVKGDGGLSFENFQDWDRSTKLPEGDLASTWLSPEVTTPYGVGKVMSTVVSSVHLPPRVQVKFPFGTGYFGFDALKQVKVETPSSMTDDQLADRWKRLITSATALGSIIDTVAMTTRQIKQSIHSDQEDTNMEDSSSANETLESLVPFGSDVLPTGLGRGSVSYKATYEELSRETRKLLLDGQGVLGVKKNQGVRTSLLAAEDQQAEKIKLKARSLHLRNMLIRQHRTRVLNEKTYASTIERAEKVESLVDEMRSDLKSLKGKLDTEMRDIGISDSKAESILTNYYKSLDSLHQGDASPPKRQRRSMPMGEAAAESDEPVAVAQAAS